jgi:WbqC-like protein family
MIVSIHQPAYLPWLGYFDRIAKSDVFIFLDTVQFERNSFINRNRIKTSTGPMWLTVPVLSQGHMSKKLAEIEIDERQDWRKKHLRSIEYNYRRAPFFAEKFERLRTRYKGISLLTDFCFDQLAFWLDELHIGTKLLRASKLNVSGSKSDLVLALCGAVGGTVYLSGPLGRDYLNDASFKAAGIELRYHDFQHPAYPQLYGDFLPAMAVVDCWMNCADHNLFAGVV